MKIGVTFGSSTNFPEMLDEIAAYDAAGADAIWLGESYGFDAIGPLGALSQITKGALLGPGIVSAYSRTPALLAQSALTLDALSGGRAVLGLGASGPAVIEGWHGVPYERPVARMAAIIDICRRVWAREVATGSRLYPVPINSRRALKVMATGPRTKIPIYIAALGAASVQMTARKADGWSSVMFWPERADGVWGNALREGHSRRSEDLAALQIVAPAHVAIDSDQTDQQWDALRAHTAHYVGGMGPRGQNFYHDVLSRYGLGIEADRIADLYLDKQREQAAAAVPQEYLDGVALIGTREHVRQRLQVYADAGVSMLNVTLAGSTSDERIAQLRLVRELAAGL
ncbi:MAG: LLM class F420-dependent oxidoreductase [Cumulibacter sp.]